MTIARLLLGVLLLALTSLSHALSPIPGEWNSSVCGPGNPAMGFVLPPGSDATKAWTCKAAIGNSRDCGWSLSSPTYGANYFYHGACAQQLGPDTCPANSSMGTNAHGAAMCSCASGLVELDGQCKPPPNNPPPDNPPPDNPPPDDCKSGTKISVLSKIGWARYVAGSGGEYPIDGGGSASVVGGITNPPAAYCDGSCVYSGGNWQGYVDDKDTPNASGLTPIYADTAYTGTGSKCSAKTDTNGPPSPPCNGSVGTINGRATCLPGGPPPDTPPGTNPGDNTGGTNTGGNTGGTNTGGGTGTGGGTNTGGTGTGGSNTGGTNTGGTGTGGTNTGGTGTGGGNTGGSGSSSGVGGGTGTGSGPPDGSGSSGPSMPGVGNFPGIGAGEAPIPELYKQKYPDGPAAVWDARIADLKKAPITGLARQLMPNVGDGGSPPSWPIDLDLGAVGNFGMHDLAPPAWLWSVLKAITILSALLLARALVFGG